MKLLILFVASLSTVTALDFGFLRGQTIENQQQLQQFACTLSGASDQDTCDATQDEQGAKCVWCTIAGFGLCVSEDIAEKMKEQIPGIECDDDSTDDAAPPDDDGPDVPGDDTVPDDYWKCLEDYGDSDSCTGAGCAWCDTKGGFGVCMDKDAAADASKSDWFTCTMPSSLPLSDPFDTSCLAATKAGSEAVCKDTLDADGFHCSWCAIGASGGLCLNDDQISIAEKLGEPCGDNNSNSAHNVVVNDPYDPSCLAVTIGGDESSCKQTMDADGSACEWCSIGTTGICLNGDQAQIAEQFGGSCNDAAGKIGLMES